MESVSRRRPGGLCVYFREICPCAVYVRVPVHRRPGTGKRLHPGYFRQDILQPKQPAPYRQHQILPVRGAPQQPHKRPETRQSPIRRGGDSDTDAKAKEQACEDASRIIEIREEEAIMQNRVAEIMSALTPQQKRAVHYRYIDNLSISEISDVMNMSYQAVLNTIQRALKRIRTNYLN